MMVTRDDLKHAASTGTSRSAGSRVTSRPDHFSTYAPRDLIRRLKVIAAIRDVPLWAVVTEAMEQYIVSYQRDHGRLPDLKNVPASQTHAEVDDGTL